MTVPTIVDTCRPRADVLTGAMTEADFAANLSAAFGVPRRHRLCCRPDGPRSPARDRTITLVKPALMPLYVKTHIQAACATSRRARKSVMTRWLYRKNVFSTRL